MCMSQTPTEDSTGVNQELLVRTCHEKERDVAGSGGHTDISQNSSQTKVYVLAPEVEHKQSNEVKKQAWTVNLR